MSVIRGERTLITKRANIFDVCVVGDEGILVIP